MAALLGQTPWKRTPLRPPHAMTGVRNQLQARRMLGPALEVAKASQEQDITVISYMCVAIIDDKS